MGVSRAVRHGFRLHGAVVGAAMLPLLCVPLAAGFMSNNFAIQHGRRPLPSAMAGDRPQDGKRPLSCARPRRGLQCSHLAQLRATVVDDDAQKDAMVEELLRAFKAKQQLNGEAAQATLQTQQHDTSAEQNGVQHAILKALGEADNLLQARGAPPSQHRKMQVLADLGEQVEKKQTIITAVDRALREADVLLSSSKTLLRREKEEADKRRDSAAAANPQDQRTKHLEEEDKKRQQVL
jgi:hypothetical protein